ncbi:hypothetical protein [Streptomyces sp. CSDS2]|uniref:hypothetical protein n=1 Tax=Streptomyces sp. CSDS2 TaxID=3055051 RepID=UPI00339D8033
MRARADGTDAGPGRREDANALTVTPEALDDFFARFEVPGADEEVIAYPGGVEDLLAELRRERKR